MIPLTNVFLLEYNCLGMILSTKKKTGVKFHLGRIFLLTKRIVLMKFYTSIAYKYLISVDIKFCRKIVKYRSFVTINNKIIQF